MDKPFRLLHGLLKRITAGLFAVGVVAISAGAKTFTDQVIKNAVSADLQIRQLSNN